MVLHADIQEALGLVRNNAAPDCVEQISGSLNSVFEKQRET